MIDLRDAGRRLRPRAVHGHRRRGRGAARPTSGRSSSTPRSCSRSRRSSRRSTSRAGRSSTRRSRSRPTATSWRSRASSSPSPGSPRGARPGMREAAPHVFGGAVVAFAVVMRALRDRSSSTTVWADRGATRPARSRRRSTRAGAPPTRPGHVDRCRRRRSTGPATAASSSSTTRSTRSTTSRGPTTSAGSSSIGGDAVAGRRTDPRRRPRPPGSAPPILARGIADASGGLSALELGAVTRREAVLIGARHLRRRARRPRRRRRPDRLPEAGGHRLLRRRRPQPARGPRPRHRRAVELSDAAARLPAPGVRGLAAAADVPRRDPDGAPRHDVRGGPGLVGPRRGARAGPGLAARAPTSPRSAACRSAAPGRWRSGPG